MFYYKYPLKMHPTRLHGYLVCMLKTICAFSHVLYQCNNARYLIPSPSPNAFYLIVCFNPDPLPLGVALGVTFTESLKGDCVMFLPALPILPHNLCAAGVSPPVTRGLLGNLGTGVLSTLPVRPSFAEVRFDSDIRSTIRW